MGKVVASFVVLPTLQLTEQTDGYWLWDTTRQMNLAMRAETAEGALIEAIKYYQNRCANVERTLNKLTEHVNHFVESVKESDE